MRRNKRKVLTHFADIFLLLFGKFDKFEFRCWSHLHGDGESFLPDMVFHAGTETAATRRFNPAIRVSG
jgi:hypothetical protein